MGTIIRNQHGELLNTANSTLVNKNSNDIEQGEEITNNEQLILIKANHLLQDGKSYEEIRNFILGQYPDNWPESISDWFNENVSIQDSADFAENFEILGSFSAEETDYS